MLNDVIIIDVVKEGIYMGISNVSSTSFICSSSSTSIKNNKLEEKAKELKEVKKKDPMIA